MTLVDLPQRGDSREKLIRAICKESHWAYIPNNTT